MQAAIDAAQRAGAARVEFDHGRIVIVLRPVDEAPPAKHPDPAAEWRDAS